jgi:hypothetical protein
VYIFAICCCLANQGYFFFKCHNLWYARQGARLYHHRIKCPLHLCHLWTPWSSTQKILNPSLSYFIWALTLSTLVLKLDTPGGLLLILYSIYMPAYHQGIKHHFNIMCPFVRMISQLSMSVSARSHKIHNLISYSCR